MKNTANTASLSNVNIILILWLIIFTFHNDYTNWTSKTLSFQQNSGFKAYFIENQNTQERIVDVSRYMFFISSFFG